MDEVNGFTNIYGVGMGLFLLCGFGPLFLKALIAGIIMKVQGKKRSKRGLKIAENIFFCAAGVIALGLLTYILYYLWLIKVI